MAKGTYTNEEVFKKIKLIIGETAPEKTNIEMIPQTSLLVDLDFESLELINTLTKIQAYFLEKNGIQIDMGEFINHALSGEFDKPFMLKDICKLITNGFNE